MRCPACRTELVVVEREAIEVDWCLECGGLWFDEGELELLGEKAGRVLDPEDLGVATPSNPEAPRRCPRCPRRMEKIALADGRLIDRCRSHGIWLDRGELAEIVRRLPTTADGDAHLVADFLGEVFEHVPDPDPPTPEPRRST